MSVDLLGKRCQPIPSNKKLFSLILLYLNWTDVILYAHVNIEVLPFIYIIVNKYMNCSQASCE